MQIPKNIEKILNRQFEIANHSINFDLIPESGYLKVGKSEKPWYDIYQFKDKEQYESWVQEAKPVIEKLGYKFMDIDFMYGMSYKYKKGS